MIVALGSGNDRIQVACVVISAQVQAADRGFTCNIFCAPVICIELLGCRRLWATPLCEIGVPKGSVYQMTASREQARGEGNCARATELGMETCEWLGNLTSKSIHRFAVETVRKPLRKLLAMNVPRRQAFRQGKSR